MNDITELFKRIIEDNGSLDIAEDEFKKMISEDEDLRAQYRDWCHEVGSTERHGFLDYCEEYMESQSSIWDSLSDPYEADE